MNITVYNSNREAIGVIDRGISLIWTERYDKPGDFELIVDLTTANVNLLAIDNYLSIDESDDWMVIETVVLTTDDERGNTLSASGRSLLSLLDRRQLLDNWAWGSGGMTSGTRADVALIAFLSANMTSVPTYPAKQVSYIYGLYTSDTRVEDLTVPLSYDYRTGNSDINLLEKILTIPEIWGVGIKSVVTPIDKHFTFEAYLGQDRSKGQTDNRVVIFSPDFNNLVESEFGISSVGEKNFMWVHGAPEPAPILKTSTWVEASEPSDISRREGFLDASYVNPYVEGTSTPKTSGVYTPELQAEGQYQIYNLGRFTYFTGKAADRIFHYRVDYWLGDIVQFENEFGLGGPAIIKEVTINKEESGTFIYPAFEFFSN